MRVHLGGHLSWYDPGKRSWVELHPAGPVSLLELAQRLGLPPGEIAVAAVNGRLAALEQIATEEDRVDFYPPMGGG